MIEALRSEKIFEMVGGPFKLTTLIQRRWLELMQGARPMVEAKGKTEMEIIVQEILEGKIELESPSDDQEHSK